jgi:ABC-type multidrug transport system fused ATPase/permease subunit
VTRNRSLLLRLLTDARVVRGRLALATIAIVVLGAAQLYLTWLVKRVVDGPARTGDAVALREIVIEGLVVIAAAAIALGVSRYFVASANHRLVERLRHRAVSRLLQLSVPAARQFASGDLMARVLTDASLLSTFLGTVVRRAVRELVVAVGAFALLFALEWRLALIGCLIVPPAAFLIARYGRRIRRSSAATQDDLGRLGALLSEQITGLTTVKGLRAEGQELARFDASSAAVRTHAMAAERQGAILTGVIFAMTGAALAAIIAWGARLIGGGAVNQATLVAFGLYAVQTVEPIRRLSELHAMAQTSLASAARLYELIDAAPEISGGALELPSAASRSLQIDGVWFAYEPDRPVFTGLSFEMGAGEQVALVGASGAGKSTLGALLVGFRSCDRGEIRLDGVPLSRLSLAALRRTVVVAEQDPFLFSGTLRDNICYAVENPTEPGIATAVRMAGLERFLQGLPKGLDTTVAEAGRQLSGGERQRLAIARAVMHDPAVLVLDEATSALDGETEMALFAGLAPWLARRTVIAISHRLSTVARFSRVVVLTHGAVAADGPLDRVLSSGTLAAELFGDQGMARTVS